MHYIEVTTAQTKSDRLGAEAAAISDSLLHFICRISSECCAYWYTRDPGFDSWPGGHLFLLSFISCCPQPLQANAGMVP
jgi:hypothetical protein